MAANLVKLISCDDKELEVEAAVAMESVMIKDMIEAIGINAPIPLPDVSYDTLVKVMEYCRYHVESRKTIPVIPEDEINAWDADFLKVDKKTISELILAAKFLKIQNLVDLACQRAADRIRNMTPEELLIDERAFTTPEEEAEFRRKWALDRAKASVERMKEVLYK